MKLLHTDALEDKYGPIRARVIKHDTEKRIREAKLVDAKNVVRTYALTFLNYDLRDGELRHIDNEIRAGGLIGETFRRNGFVIERIEIARFTIPLPQWLQTDFSVTESSATAAIVGFCVKKNSGKCVPYGTIFEIYSPDFMGPGHLPNSQADHASQFLCQRALSYLNERAI